MGILFGDRPFTGRTPGQGERELLGPRDLGQQFYVPDVEAKNRLRGYLDADAFMDTDKHLDLFKQSRQNEAPNTDTDKFWIALDFPGMLARLMRDYTIGEEFRVKARLLGQPGNNVSGELAEAQGHLNRIMEASHLRELLRQSTEALPALGDAVLRVDVEDRMGDDGQVIPQAIVRYVSPTHYFPQLNALDQTKVDAVTLAWVFPASGATETSRDMVVLREMHTVGNVRYALNAWDGEKLGKPVDVDTMFPDLVDRETGIDEIAVIHMGYQVKAGRHFGNSEVNRVKDLVLRLENRLSQEDEVLEKHARPKLVVGPGILDEQGRANLKDFDIIEVSPDVFEKHVRPEYLTWDTQIQGVQHEIEKLEEYFFMTTETSPASFGLERDGSQVESARALRFKAHRTVNKVSDVRGMLERSIMDTLRIAQKLELAARKEDGKSGYRRSGSVIRFGDPILEDQSQEVEDLTAMKREGLVSRKRAVQDLHNLTPEETDREVTEILQDQVDDAAAATATFQGSPATTAGAPPAVTEETEPTRNTAGDPGLGIEEDIQKQLLNGAQVSAMVSVVSSVNAGQLPRESGLEILQVAFGVSAEEAAKLMGPAGEGFEPNRPSVPGPPVGADVE